MAESTAVVRLTDAQRRALRSLASVTVDAGEGGIALARALEALDAATPVLTKAQYKALVYAQVEWEGSIRTTRTTPCGRAPSAP